MLENSTLNQKLPGTLLLKYNDHHYHGAFKKVRRIEMQVADWLTPQAVPAHRHKDSGTQQSAGERADAREQSALTSFFGCNAKDDGKKAII